MRCEQARDLLPGYLDDTAGSGAVLEVHLATCAECAGLLAEYREMLRDLSALDDRGEQPSIELVERVLESIPAPRLAARVLGSLRAHPVLYGVASVGGATAGATAFALLWRRRRSPAAAT